MTDLETLARDLRSQSVVSVADWTVSEREEWLAVARHVQQLQRAAWIAGRNAALLAVQKEAVEETDDLDKEYNMAVRDCETVIRALEQPAQETGQ